MLDPNPNLIDMDLKHCSLLPNSYLRPVGTYGTYLPAFRAANLVHFRPDPANQNLKTESGTYVPGTYHLRLRNTVLCR